MSPRALFASGALLLAAVWCGPLPQMAQRLFWAHMTMHMAVVAVAAPLLAFGVAGSRLDPVRRWPRLFAPIPASALELVVVWAWHSPALHHAARHSSAAFVAEQSTFLAVGVFLWLAAVGDPRRRAADRGAAGVIGLLLTSMHMTLLGALLALAPRPLYPHHGDAAGLTALADQHLGGAIMLVAGALSYLCGGLWLMTRLLRQPRAVDEAVACDG